MCVPVAALILLVTVIVPWLGGLIAFAALLAGLGAIVLQVGPRGAVVSPGPGASAPD